MTITQEEQSSISEELKVLIAKRNDYEHSSVKNFSRFFADFLSANNAEIAKEFLEEIKLQRAFLSLETEFSLFSDCHKIYGENPEKLAYALETLAKFSEYLESKIEALGGWTTEELEEEIEEDEFDDEEEEIEEDEEVAGEDEDLEKDEEDEDLEENEDSDHDNEESIEEQAVDKKSNFDINEDIENAVEEYQGEVVKRGFFSRIGFGKK